MVDTRARGLHNEEGAASFGTVCSYPPDEVQITKKARERSETVRIEYRLKIGSQYTPEQLIFVDESACDRRTFLRSKAWALRGHKATRKQFFARGKRCAALRS